MAVTCLRTTQSSCGRRWGAEARSRGAFGPREETGVYEVQREGLWRPQEGRDGMASGKQGGAAVKGTRSEPRRLAASWPPPGPDEFTVPSVGVPL